MDHVIVGAGPAGITAAETLRRADPEGSVTLIGGEPGPPYGRMAAGRGGVRRQQYSDES